MGFHMLVADQCSTNARIHACKCLIGNLLARACSIMSGGPGMDVGVCGVRSFHAKAVYDL